MNENIKENDIANIQSETTVEETDEDSFEGSEETSDDKVKDSSRERKIDSRTPVKITHELLKEVQQQLCLVKLCWPKVDIFREDLYLKALPESYYTVSDKERLLAWYAENFRKQFHVKFPNRKPLLLMCDNECGVQKFVSTTIRRSTLPYPELYTWQGCGKFVSDYIEYEPLDKALGMPKQLRSPTRVLNFQKGNCFEIATVLASLLLGQNYNAFVANGYASREQTLYNMTRRSCPYLPQTDQPTSPPLPVDTHVSKYKPKPPPDFTSQFLLELDTKEQMRIETERQKEEEEFRRIIREFELPPADEYWGHRKHAWVIILPERKGPRNHEISKPIFIEPSSGEFYMLNDRLANQIYLGVESIWNDQNYWVNVQSAAEGCATIKWDLNNLDCWEHVLPGEPWTTHDVSDEIDEDVIIQQEKHLDMPLSYVNKINISEIDFERRYPGGSKTIHYKKAIVELYTPYMQDDGMVQRVTVYDNYNYTGPAQVYQKYQNRSDKLVECRKNLKDDSVVDYYTRGRPDQCKEHRYFASGDETVESERIIDFYYIPRPDGLSRIESHPTYLTQYYEDRDDFLYYRQVEFFVDEDALFQDEVHYRHIQKIIEKFHRNEKMPASKNIAIREFDIVENKIRLLYHYEEGRYTRATRTYIRPPLAERGERLVFDPSMTQGYNPDVYAQSVKSLDLYYELVEQLKEEDRSVSSIRAAEVEIVSFLKTRSNEYLTPELLTSAFDRNRDTEAAAEVVIMDEKMRDETEREIAEEIDFLKPYLARIGNPSDLNPSIACLLADKCLNDYKQLLVRRANDILRKFEECTQELEKTQILITQNEDLTREEEEEILQKTNEINFRLHTLEIRLNRHKELAPYRYMMLMQQLQQQLHMSEHEIN